MTKTKKVLSSITGTTAICVVIGYTITHSLWFLTSFVPEDSSLIWASQGNHPLIQLVNTQAGLLGLDVEQDGIDPKDFSHLVLAKKADSTHLSGISRSIQGTLYIRQNLEQNGWQVQSIGSFISAQKGRLADVLTGKVLLSRSWDGIRQIIRHSREGISPIGIIHVAKNSIPLADTTYDGIIKQARHDIRVSIKHPHGQPAPTITFEKKDQNIPISGIKFALSGKILARIPKDLQSSSLAKITGNLHITRKQADLTKLIKEASFIAGESNTKETGLAIIGDKTGLASTLQKVVAGEEGYYHPQRRPFRLPDGSIGFELRPGQPAAVWSQVNESCGYYNGQEHQWWVCNNDKIASIGTSQNMAQSLLNNYDQAIWMVTLGKDRVPESLRQDIQTIQTVGTSEQTNIIIE